MTLTSEDLAYANILAGKNSFKSDFPMSAPKLRHNLVQNSDCCFYLFIHLFI